MKKILIINTGGTLSAVVKQQGMAPGLSTNEMLEELHMVSKNTELSMTDLCALDSANIFPDDWAAIAAKVAECKNDHDGIVIIHGTDTMAYTSSMLSFMLRNINIPVVITGSQLSISNPVADATENLRCAIYMAASGYGGVFLAFNRKVMLGCRASKVNTISFDAFESINYPYIAEISSMGMQINDGMIPKKRGVFSLNARYSDRIAAVKLFPGIDVSVFLSLKDKGYRAVYVEAYGLGGMPFIKKDITAALGDLVSSGVFVLVGTQCMYGGSDLTVYETGRKALERGVAQAHDMTSEAAVTKLMWVLGQTGDLKEIEEYFSIDLCGEVSISI